MGQSLNHAGFVHPFSTAAVTPSNPTSTSSGTGVMMGLGSTCTITPGYNGRVVVTFTGSGAVTVATAAFNYQIRSGTGAAPSNGAALTGTTRGGLGSGWSAVANSVTPFAISWIVTGLTPGTAVWFDLSLAVSTGTGTLSNLNFTAMEF